MPETIGTLELKLEADISRLKSDLKRAEAQANTAGKRIARNMQGAFKGVGNIRVKLGLVAFALTQIAALGGLNKLIKSAIDTADAIGKVSQKLGISTSALQELQFAANQSGVKIESLNMGLQRFGRRAAEAASGTGEAKDAIAQLGIQLKDSNGTLRSTEALFTDAMKALSKIENPLERVRLGFKLFDSEGVAIVNMADNVVDLRLEAQRLGIVLDDEVVASATRTKDEMEALAKVTSANLAPALTDLGGRALVGVYTTLAEVSKWANKVYRAFADIENLGMSNVQMRMKEASDELAEAQERLLKHVQHMSGAQRNSTKDTIKAREAELVKLRQKLKDLKAERKAIQDANAESRSAEQAKFKTEQERKKDAAERVKEVARLRKIEDDAHVAWQEMMGHERQIIRDTAQEKVDALRTVGVLTVEQAATIRKIREVEADEIAKIDDEEADRKKKFLDTLQRQYLRATGQRLDLIQMDLDAQIDSLDKKLLGEEAYNEAIVKLKVISNAKIQKLRDKDLEDQKKIDEEKKEELQGLYDFMEDGFNDALATMLITGEFTFKSLAQSFLREFVQRGLQKVDWASLIKNIGGILGGGSGVGSSTINIIGGVGNTGTAAHGGPVGGGTPVLIGERGPELFMPGKSGFVATNQTLQSMMGRSGQGSGVNVTVINNTGQESTTTERDGPNGDRNIEVLIGKAISKNIQRGGDVDQAIRNSYGVNRVGRHGL